ncbi:MAG: DUF1501 domain-containing protein [Bacteroidetes bacterium]|nr:DUF1501 domain-containing protein [Bacteroidota bacterium]
MLNRREFLRNSTLATTALWMPRFLKSLSPQGALPNQGKILILLQLSGGNDGLNTVIPFRNDIYYRERDSLAIPRAEALALDDQAGLHPALAGMKGLFDDGSLAILNRVGYPNPDRSHFRSMDIWHSASPSDVYWNSGWIGRYLDAQCKGACPPTAALEIDETLSMALKGEKVKGLALQDVKRLYDTTKSPYFQDYLQNHPTYAEDAPVAYLYKTMSETLNSAEYLHAHAQKRDFASVYPDTPLGKDFKTIANLILSDVNTAVYYVSHGSFDTHVNQDGQQKRLFTVLDEAIKAFSVDMQTNGRWKDVLILSFSEFGRRVAQNASGGTDHGAANNLFLMGGGLKKQGMLNAMPDLLELNDGDVPFEVDFRQIYATVLQKWLGADADAVLGSRFELLDFV